MNDPHGFGRQGVALSVSEGIASNAGRTGDFHAFGPGASRYSFGFYRPALFWRSAYVVMNA
jgi:hypothetical protein